MKKLLICLVLAASPLWSQTFTLTGTNAQIDSALVRANRVIGTSTISSGIGTLTSYLKTPALYSNDDSALASVKFTGEGQDSIGFYTNGVWRGSFSKEGVFNVTSLTIAGVAPITAVDSTTKFLSIGDAASTYLTQAASTVDSATASHMIWKDADGEIGDMHATTGLTFSAGTLTTNRNTTQMKADTSAIFAFGGGGGNAGDTTAFTTSTIYGSFFNKGTDTLYVTSLYCVMRHGIGLDTIDVQVLWDDTLGTANATKLNTAAFPVNSVGGILNGVEDASFANSKIPPGNWVWCTTPTGITAGRKPTYLSATISGYRGK
jgi:hypothetical protein